ncbi:glycine--tRNA ligase subunit beta [Candidatus Endomicrobiellum devescovinae]|uniref:glycine--tRNA ligase subunit beta n=1 Tax=Candidatus Endomicrobiellum devescovinae TaxID=3242322 RepID=UPI00283419DE|nr:glycine--tRNA ligase subunit beta [Endomicrobium sp.]
MSNDNERIALLEIGTEEIPTSYIEPALKQIEQTTLKEFANLNIKHGSIKTFATPRRLTLIVENLSIKSEDKSEEILGPSWKAAKDINGQWTQAAKGFATKNGTMPDKLNKKITEKGEYLSFTKKTKGEKTETLLTVIFPKIISSISFPKAMVWEESEFKFARPIRNIIALFGKKVIKFKIADVNSSNWTIGLHTYDRSKIKIDSPENYMTVLKNKSVLVDQNERCEEMKKSIEFVVKSVGTVVADEALVDEVNYLVEYPSAVLCDFDKKYLDLPSEVLTVCMKKSQKCFAVNDKSGKFLNCFVGVKNGVSKYLDIAKEGYERVVAARLADAEFFYKNDLKSDLNANIEKLKGVVFHKEIGTIYEKIERVKKIALLFNKEFSMQVDEKSLERAVMLSKADLVSEMVFEYPELQGVMGKIYALKSGVDTDVAESVEQHYLPLSASGKLPSNKLASLISLADKIDTLAANFSIGLEPSGSADPYGLRRAGIGFIRIATEILPNKELSSAIEKVFEFLPENIKNNPKSKMAYEKLINFLRQRIEGILESEGYSFDEVKSVVSILGSNKFKDLGSFLPKLAALKNARQKGDFSSISAVFKRINNILSQARKQNIDVLAIINESLLVEGAEKNLFDCIKKTKAEVVEYISQNKYAEVFDKVLEIKPSIDGFFEKVMVMAEDAKIKSNRISLLNYTKGIFAEFLDFSALQ